ncbi:N-6 DNA methylase [Noviherbaspirillum pedocola]|uniref:SAM-dependent DNA methyltransferase n=1 Tax=Noviherbaspirillum pedocola TaxID=2801341 RepID=A0A934T1K8_9BURK|nr:N-6 DNA methylase [Noviherbaspirillum pedocola]MBK4737357.1 SAM-dependent DNA methyltransferase [Noviherbaspirillum pedocola]
MDKELGQYMTPPAIAKMAAKELGQCDVVIDFAVGDGSLLKAVCDIAKNQVQLIGFDVDRKMVAASKNLLSNAQIRNVNGLRARLGPLKISGNMGIICNPPFLGDLPDDMDWIKKAFPEVQGKKGFDRAEVQFLARALVTGRQFNAKIIIILPIGFADGDTYSRIRASLMKNYRLRKCIEVVGTPFMDTEARTVALVIDTSHTLTKEVEVCEFDVKNQTTVRVVKKHLIPGARLDARYHKAHSLAPHTDIVLKDLRVSITRGLYSRKEAVMRNVDALHTSDLAQARAGRLAANRHTVGDKERHVIAKKGDILLPRTGSRVSWNPVVLDSGNAPITDHVFRIRAPKAVRELVYQSFIHPSFQAWLHGISKGVCAKVVTKRELLEMPVFAWGIKEVTTYSS